MLNPTALVDGFNRFHEYTKIPMKVRSDRNLRLTQFSPISKGPHSGASARESMADHNQQK